MGLSEAMPPTRPIPSLQAPKRAPISMNLLAADAALLGRPTRFLDLHRTSRLHVFKRICTPTARISTALSSLPCGNFKGGRNPFHFGEFDCFRDRTHEILSDGSRSEPNVGKEIVLDKRVRVFGDSVRWGIRFGVSAMVCGLFVMRSQRVLAADGVAEACVRVLGTDGIVFRGLWSKILQVLSVLKAQGLILAALLGLSAFFSMAETSITTLWPWKIRELAEKEPENGVFRMLRSDVTRFLTTILIGTTVVNIGATALVTEAATTIFGEAGVSAATGVMTVAILLLTEITPKSVAVHNATEVARVVVRPVAWLSLVLYPVGRVATFLSMGMLKMIGLKGRREPYVTEDEVKLMLRGAEDCGAIEEDEQDMIENVLEIKDTHVREVMTPLVDVVAIDASSKLVDFQKLWETHQYSRVPVFEERIDNIVGIAYAMDMLECVKKVEKLKETTVKEIAHMPTYFVPDSMSVWNLLREFRVRKVHMAVVLNEYGGTVGIVTLEDVVEEIVGEIFDENDSREEIQKKTGHIVMQEDGTFDVDANTSIDQLSEELNIKIPEGHQYETVSGFICESFGYIPEEGGRTVVVLEKENQEENGEYTDTEYAHHNKQTHQTYELEIMEANARKVSKVRFKPIHNDKVADLETKGIKRLVSTKVIKRKNPSDPQEKMEEGHPSQVQFQGTMEGLNCYVINNNTTDDHYGKDS